MRTINASQFLDEYEYQVEKDFDVDGTQASWADTETKSGHRFWGDENHKIDIPFEGDSFCSAISAISADGELIAAAGCQVVSIYHVASKECRSQFRGLTSPCQSLLFTRPAGEKKGYQLVIGTEEPSGRDPGLLFLELDEFGRQFHDFQPLEVTELVEKSLEPIASELKRAFDIASTSPLIDSLRADYTQSLKKIQSSLEAKGHVQLTGQISSNSNGDLLLYLTHNESTQSGMRPLAELPQIVIYNFVEHTQKHVLGGHKDAITWASFSPDGQKIASVAWDGTMRIMDTETGEWKVVIGPTGGQCWTGAWSPDSRHILFCGIAISDGDEGERVESQSFATVYSIETGDQIASFKVGQLQHWVRNVAWSPRGDVIALAHETDVWVWNPFEGSVVSSFSLSIPDRMYGGFAEISNLGWQSDGKSLFVYSDEGTIEVWDREENLKWRLQRSKEPQPSKYASCVNWVGKQRTIVSLDGDKCLRFWEL